MVHRAILAGLRGLFARTKASQDVLKYTGINEPHVFKSRVSLLDLDFNLHMNNASTLYATELARWHLLTQNGLVGQIVKNRWMILLAGVNVKFKREFKPFSAYEIKTSIDGYRGEWIYITHTFVNSKNKVQAVVAARGVVVDRNKKKLDSSVLFKSIGLSDDEVNGIYLDEKNPMYPSWKSFLDWDDATYAFIKKQE